jgi:hypothetical protein
MVAGAGAPARTTRAHRGQAASHGLPSSLPASRFDSICSVVVWSAALCLRCLDLAYRLGQSCLEADISRNYWVFPSQKAGNVPPLHTDTHRFVGKIRTWGETCRNESEACTDVILGGDETTAPGADSFPSDIPLGRCCRPAKVHSCRKSWLPFGSCIAPFVLERSRTLPPQSTKRRPPCCKCSPSSRNEKTLQQNRRLSIQCTVGL